MPTSQCLNRVETILTGYGLRVCYYQGKGDARRLYVASRAFRRWLLDLGLDYVTAEHKKIPAVMFNASSTCRAAFLRGLFDTNGSAGIGSSSQLRLITSSPQLAREVQTLLLTLGIVSRRNQWTPRAWCLSLGGTSLPLYVQQIGFVVPEKQERLMALLTKQRNGKTNDDFFPNGKLLGETISNAFRQIPTTLFQSQFGKSVGAVLSNVKNDRSRLTYRHLRDFVALFTVHRVQPPCELRLSLENNYFHDPIASIEPLSDAVTMYDITVEGEHSFVAGGGFVCHNSQGSEYPAAIILMANQHYMMLQRNLLYTALTRAKKMAVIIGSKYAMKTAINNRLVAPRFTRLAERLQNLVESLSSRRQLSLLESGADGLTNRDLSHPPLPGRLL